MKLVREFTYKFCTIVTLILGWELYKGELEYRAEMKVLGTIAKGYAEVLKHET